MVAWWIALALMASGEESVQATLSARGAELGDCLRAHGVSSASFEIRFALDAEARATGVRLEGPVLPEGAERCVRTIVGRLRFTGVAAGTEVHYPFALRVAPEAEPEQRGAGPRALGLHIAPNPRPFGEPWLVLNRDDVPVSDFELAALAGTEEQRQRIDERFSYYRTGTIVSALLTVGAGAVAAYGGYHVQQDLESPATRDLALLGGGGAAFFAAGLTTLYYLVRASDVYAARPMWRAFTREEVELMTRGAVATTE